MMGYALSAVQGLEACPFCKELFPQGETRECPTCGVALVSMRQLTASAEALDEDETTPAEPRLPLTHWGHARGPLIALAALGLVAFLLPWIHQYTPNQVTFTGVDISRRTGLSWSVGAAWFTLLPLLVSRRTIRALQGVRLVAAMLAVIPAITAGMLLLNPPRVVQAAGVVMRVRFDWAPALYATLALSLLATVLAVFFLGGPLRAAPKDAPDASDEESA
jgi:hypothetical protein